MNITIRVKNYFQKFGLYFVGGVTSYGKFCVSLFATLYGFDGFTPLFRGRPAFKGCSLKIRTGMLFMAKGVNLFYAQDYWCDLHTKVQQSRVLYQIGPFIII